MSRCECKRVYTRVLGPSYSFLVSWGFKNGVCLFFFFFFVKVITASFLIIHWGSYSILFSNHYCFRFLFFCRSTFFLGFFIFYFILFFSGWVGFTFYLFEFASLFIYICKVRQKERLGGECNKMDGRHVAALVGWLVALCSAIMLTCVRVAIFLILFLLFFP